MTYIPLDIPAGFYRNGTDLEQSNRWRDGSLVRWRDGSLRPIKGWVSRKASYSTSTIRGMHAWESLNGSTYLAGGSYNELKVMVGSNTLYDVTPSDLTAGIERATVITGYGYGDYNADDYGVARQNYGNYSEATTWSLDNWGEYLVACSCKVGGAGDGRLLEWQLNSALGSELISNGDFATYPDTDWITNTGWIISNSGQSAQTAAFSSGTSTPSNLEQNSISMTAGKKYRLVFTVYNMVSTTTLNVKVGINLGLGSEELFLEKDVYNGTHTFEFGCLTTSSAVQIRFIRNTTGGDGFNIDNVSIKEAPQAAVISNAPIDCLGLITTEERFLFALGAGGNPRKVQWCDQENNTVWAAAATNQAGDIELQTSGQIMQAVRTRGQTLIITDFDAHSARYIGPPYVFGFERVGTSCGTASRKAAIDVDAGVFWMGQRGFFTFAGNTVQRLPCAVHDYVFDDFNRDQQSQVWAWANTEYGEVWWFYPSSDSQEVDRYVAFNYNENYWTIGELSRTSGVARGVFKYPLMIGTNKTVYEHELGFSYDSATVFAETGPVSLGSGDQTMHVVQLVPDEKTQGDVSVKFKTRFYPNDTETTHGPYTPANPTGVRFSGRQFRMRVEGSENTDWRVGNMRVDAVPAGRR